MSALEQLKALRIYLRTSGSVVLQSQNVAQLGQKQHALVYTTDGLLPYTWPVTGQAHISLIWDDNKDAWTCSGHMFGQTPSATEPKAFFHQVARGVKMREQLLKAFFQQAMTYWERYAGDLEQFQYRLGIQLASSGHMARHPQSYSWTSATDPTVQVWMSPDPTPPGFGMPPRAKFGFFDDPRTHQWSLTVANIAKFRDDVSAFSHEAREFCKGASACFGVTDFSDVAD